MLNLKKALSVVVVLALSTSMLIGCGKSSGQPAAENTSSAGTNSAAAVSTETGSGVPKEFVELKVLYPGDMSGRMEDFLNNEYKDRLKNDLNMSLEVMYSPWDQYWNKKDMMLAANEQIDWYWDGFSNLSQMTSKNQNIPLDDLLKYAPDLLKAIPMENINAAKINGKIMGIPATNAPTSAMLQQVDIRQDLLEAVGMTEIKTTADLKQFGEKVKAKYPDMNAGSHPVISALAREFSDQGLIFITDSFMLCAGQDDNKIYSFYETDAYKKLCEYNRELYLEKLYTDDVTIKYNEGDARMKTGKYIWGEASLGKNLEIIQDVRKNAPDAKLETYLIAPDKPKYRASPSGEVICISPTSVNTERTVMYLNWIFKNQDNYLTTIYGLKDKDYKIENNRIKLLTNDSFFYEWMFRNVNYQMFTDDVSDKYIETYKNWDKDAKLSNTFGFVFDSSSVKTEEARIKDVVGKQLVPMSTGFIDSKDNYEKAMKALKTAGIDKYREECQKQFDAFLAGK